jgi:two-component system response regulator GlrR
MRITQAALDKLIAYRWPGNVRELVNLLERAVLLAGNRVIDVGDVIVPNGVAAEPRGAALVPYREAKAKFDLDYYTQLMRSAGGNVSRAAKLGRKTRKEIYDALKRCGLEVKRRSDAP